MSCYQVGINVVVVNLPFSADSGASTRVSREALTGICATGSSATSDNSAKEFRSGFVTRKGTVEEVDRVVGWRKETKGRR